jgi:hypothetical protein
VTRDRCFPAGRSTIYHPQLYLGRLQQVVQIPPHPHFGEERSTIYLSNKSLKPTREKKEMRTTATYSTVFSPPPIFAPVVSGRRVEAGTVSRWWEQCLVVRRSGATPTNLTAVASGESADCCNEEQQRTHLQELLARRSRSEE